MDTFAILENTVLSFMLQVGHLKAAGVGQFADEVARIDDATRQQIETILSNGGGDEHRRYMAALLSYIEGGGSLADLITYIDGHYDISFGGLAQFEADFATHGPMMVVATHNKQAPDVDILDPDTGRVVHDIGPVLTKVTMDIALRDSSVQIARMVRSPRPSEVYKRCMVDVGNALINGGGVNAIVSGLRGVVDSGKLPLMSPEGGFRVLDVWKTGPVVLAVKAGITRLALVAHSPIVSTFYPTVRYDYIGSVEIPAAVISAVHGNDCDTVRAFCNELRARFATAIQNLPYPQLYKAAVAKYANT